MAASSSQRPGQIRKAAGDRSAKALARRFPIRRSRFCFHETVIAYPGPTPTPARPATLSLLALRVVTATLWRTFSWSGKFDGKDYPVSGDPNSDARSYRKVNERTLTTTNKKNGKVTVTGQIVFSADGKSRTVTLNGTTSKGKKFKNVAVYDKE
jgi:hypothetical protein